MEMMPPTSKTSHGDDHREDTVTTHTTTPPTSTKTHTHDVADENVDTQRDNVDDTNKKFHESEMRKFFIEMNITVEFEVELL
jgi:hypothetical protein